ncbi:MAG: DUF456 domain-containing protein [Haloferacaceae archaeon]
MVDPVAVVAVGLLAAGVVGSVVPAMPSGLLSLAGVYAYVLFGADRIGPFLLVGLTAVGLVAAAVEQFAGPIAARASGASTRTALAAAAGGVVAFLVAGPVGLLVGMVAVVFALELHRGAGAEGALRRSAATVLGILVSSAVQVLLTASILVAFVVALPVA